MSNGLDIARCLREGREEVVICRDDTEDELDGCLTGGEDLDCSCVESTCLQSVNEFLSQRLKREVQCSNLEITLCPENTFQAEDLRQCEEEFVSEEERCACFFNKCGGFVDGGTLVTVLIYLFLLISVAFCFVLSAKILYMLRERKTRRWIIQDNKVLGVSLVITTLSMVFIVIAISAQLRVMFASRNKDYDSTVKVRADLEAIIQLSSNIYPVLGFMSIMLGERLWLDVAYKISYYWKASALEELERLKCLMNATFAILLLFFFSAVLVFVNVQENQLRFDEGANLTTTLEYTFLLIFTMFSTRKLNEVFAMHSTNRSTKDDISQAKKMFNYIAFWEMFWLVLAIIAFALDTGDVTDYPNYSEADYSFLLEVMAVANCEIGLHLFAYWRIQSIQKRFKHEEEMKTKQSVLQRHNTGRSNSELQKAAESEEHSKPEPISTRPKLSLR